MKNTKCTDLQTVINAYVEPATQKKPIKLESFITCNAHARLLLNKSAATPRDFDNIVLAARKEDTLFGADVILAYDNDSNRKILYMGQWNDGVVE